MTVNDARQWTRRDNGAQMNCDYFDMRCCGDEDVAAVANVGVADAVAVGAAGKVVVVAVECFEMKIADLNRLAFIFALTF